MATKKKLLQAAAGSAGGGEALNVEDVFSTYVYEGNGTSYSIDNGINLGQSNGSGGIDTSLTSQSAVIVNGDADFGYGTGDFTIELWVWINKLYDFIEIWDQRTATQDATTTTPILYSSDSGAIFYFHSSGNKISSNNGALSEGAWNHIALTRYGGSTKLFVDGTQVGNTYFDSTNYVAPVSDWSFGGSLAQGQYNLDGYVSNARVVKGTAVYTGNFTVPTSELTNITNTVLLTAQGSTPLVDNSSSSHTVTTNEGAKASTFGPFDAAEAGEGGLVWFKSRTSSANSHKLFDTERGALRKLHTDETIASTQETDTLSSFNANGFSILSDAAINSSTADIASWTFRKAPKFFDVVTYTGNGTSGRTVSHNLGTTVGSIFVKRTDSTANWMVYHRGNTSAPHTDFLKLNLTDATQDAVSIWNDTAPTSTEFTVGSSNDVNASGGTYVAYLFAHNDGDGEFGPDGDADIIKCGSYTGTGSVGLDVDLGWEPQWLLVKRTDSADNWVIADNMRGIYGQNSPEINHPLLQANESIAEFVSSYFKLNADGFQLQSTAGRVNESGGNYIYIAIRRGPMAVPTDATDVFDASYGTSNGNTPINLGFSTDTMLYKNTSGSDGYISTRLTGAQYMSPNSTAAEATGGDVYWDDMDGIAFNNNSSFTSWIFYNWKRAPNYFDAVAYTGNGTSGRTVSHNLGVAPEMMWVKCRNSVQDWSVYHSSITNPEQNYLYLNATSALNPNSNTVRYWNHTAPTDSVFTLGDEDRVNGSANTYIAYLFATVDGVSKVGGFTSDGTNLTIDCGFTSGARFILLKDYSALGAWFVWDSERGIVAGNDPSLKLNDTTAENTSNDFVDPHSSGFIVNSSFTGTGKDWLFYAIA